MVETTYSTVQIKKYFAETGVKRKHEKEYIFVNVFDFPEVAGNIEAMFKCSKKNGVSGLQIPYDSLTRLDREKFKSLLEKYNVELFCTFLYH